MKRLDSAGACCGCLGALVAGDLVLPDQASGGGNRADTLLPLFVPGERAQERRAWLADVLIALLQRSQACTLLFCPCSTDTSCLQIPAYHCMYIF